MGDNCVENMDLQLVIKWTSMVYRVLIEYYRGTLKKWQDNGIEKRGKISSYTNNELVKRI
jgi:hypothetical protein